jgi:hypothetical protein
MHRRDAGAGYSRLEETSMSEETQKKIENLELNRETLQDLSEQDRRPGQGANQDRGR